jgi:YesN/AraC family two-component response regulator
MVTDVIMPGMDGCGLAQIVYERWPHIRVLFVSGYSDNAIKLHGILGADAQILSKPFRKADLAMRVRASLDL